jgi:negative regulator of sigma E activity
MADECACCADGEDFDELDQLPDEESVSTSVVVYENRAPAERRGGALVQSVRHLPAPVVKTAAAVAVGAAVQIGVVLAGKYFASQAAQKSAKSLAANGRGRRRARAEAEESPLDGATTLTETLVVRRVWVRRDKS